MKNSFTPNTLGYGLVTIAFGLTWLFGEAVFSVSYAANPAADNDCPMVKLFYDEKGQERKIDNGRSTLFDAGADSAAGKALETYPEENVRQAIENLRGYCCQEGYFSTQDETGKAGVCKPINATKPQRAASRFLYDHLIDIGFRHLDGFRQVSYPKMAQEPDKKTEEWRKEIGKFAVAADGAIPLQIVSTFERLWYDEVEEGATPKSPAKIIAIDRTMDLNKAMLKYGGDGYEELGMASRYYATCYTALFLNPDLSKNGSKKSNYEACRMLANERINKEVAYVKIMEVEKGARLLAQNMNKYTKKYFVENRMMKLVDKWGNLGSLINYVSRKTQGTHDCSS